MARVTRHHFLPERESNGEGGGVLAYQKDNCQKGFSQIPRRARSMKIIRFMVVRSQCHFHANSFCFCSPFIVLPSKHLRSQMCLFPPSVCPRYSLGLFTQSMNAMCLHIDGSFLVYCTKRKHILI